MPLGAYLAVSAALFALGLVCIVTRRNIIYVLMGIEMILNAVSYTHLTLPTTPYV